MYASLAPARARLHELHPLDYSVYLVPTAPDTMTNSCHVWNICLRTSRARKVLCEGILHILIVLHMINFYDQSINQPTNQSTNQSINQSINQSVNQPTNQSINQSINQPTNQSINQSINQSTSVFIMSATGSSSAEVEAQGPRQHTRIHLQCGSSPDRPSGDVAVHEGCCYPPTSG